MKLYVPELGDKLKLTADWTFDLYHESRNENLLKHFFGENFQWESRHNPPKKVTLPKGTILTVDRIYIRKGASEYSSISFYASGIETPKSSFGKPKRARFWATLSDCNTIEFQPEKTTKPLKLIFNVLNVKEGSSTYSTSSQSSKGTVMTPISSIANKDLLNISLTFDVEKITTKIIHSFFSHHDQYIIRNVQYTLYTLSGEIIGNYKTYEAMKVAAKKWIESVS